MKTKEELFYEFATLFASAPAEVRNALVAGYALRELKNSVESAAPSPT